MNEILKEQENQLFTQLSALMHEMQNVFRKLKLDQKYTDLFTLSESLSDFSVISGILELSKLSLTANLAYSLSMKIFSEKRTLSSEYINLLSRFLKELVARMVQIEKSSGNCTDADNNLLSSFWEKDTEDPLPLITAAAKQQIRQQESFRYKSLNLSEDDDFAHAIRLPNSITLEKDKQSWLSLIYLDLNKNDNLNELLYYMRKSFELDDIKLHGRLNLPVEQINSKNPGISYYLVLRSPIAPEQWLQGQGLSGKIIRILQRPSIQRDLQMNPSSEKMPKTEIIEQIKEVPVVDDELRGHLKALAERNKREEEKEYYRQLNLQKPGKIAKEGKGLTIGFKLILMISTVILLSLSVMTFMSSYLFIEDLKTRIEVENLGTSSMLAEQTEQNLWSIYNRSQLLLLGLTGEAQDQEYLDFFFNRNPDFLYIGLADQSFSHINNDFLLDNNLTKEYLEELILPVYKDLYNQIRNSATAGDVQILNFSPFFDQTVTAALFPYKEGVESKVLITLMDTDLLLNTLLESGNDQNESFIINKSGDLISHRDRQLVMDAVSYIDHPIVKEIQQNSSSSKQIQYVIPSKEEGNEEDKTYLGAFKYINFGDLIFITQVEESLAFESVYSIQKKNFFIMMIVVSLSILIVYFYSKSITIPIAKLVIATRYIDKGNYNLPLQVRNRDEIGILTRSFLDMSKGLKERERLKESFGRFVNKEIAEMATKGSLALGGETKEATIFFSDIRNFTAISEKMDPQEVVHFLNEYMTLMVNCINEQGGFVDKFIGDAIMAVWGAPLSRGKDEILCIDGALKMRELLQEYNKDRGTEKKPLIHIGCGINSGPVLAGQIGSEKRMEYTVIGDTVNLASRIEGLNKPMGTDILISQETKERVEGIYNLVAMNTIKVKGKSKNQQIFAVLGRKDNPECPKDLHELRKIVGIKGDFSRITDLEQEEVKYEIID